MIPVLNLEGEFYAIESIDYLHGKPMTVVIERDGVKQFFHDASMSANPNAFDLSDAIHFKGRYGKIIIFIDELLEERRKKLSEVSTRIADLTTMNGHVPGSLIIKYTDLKNLVQSLSYSKDIVLDIIAIENDSI